nr:ribonuclease H-like domain-containing protein [Tanacetum cinerariifolium]
NVVPSPCTGNFMPPKPDLVYPSLDDFVDVNEYVSESVVEKPTVESNEPKTFRKKMEHQLLRIGYLKQDLKDKGVIDSGRSRHMTGNRSYLTDYKEIDKGFAFGGNSKEGKDKIRTSKLDFKDVYFVKELKFNLFSILQMCDKKNSVLYTDTACVVLSSDFKLTDESHVLLKDHRKDNMVMNQFCEMKGIKREFSIARTPHQNGVAERKNKTLMEAATTMLADSKLPTTFWAKAVNTACYVQNRVIVEENMHVKFSENTPNIVESGAIWLFDIDALTKSINYKPVVVGNQSNGSAGTKTCDIVGKTRVEIVPKKDYVLLPLWTQVPLFFSSSKDSPGVGYKPSGKEEKKDAKDLENEDNEALSTEEPRVNQKNESVNSTNRVNAVSSAVNPASNQVNAAGRKLSIELPDYPTWNLLFKSVLF